MMEGHSPSLHACVVVLSAVAPPKKALKESCILLRANRVVDSALRIVARYNTRTKPK